MTAPEPVDDLAARCLDLLRSGDATLATAESLTAGLVAATLAGIPGASDVLRGGLIAYASDVKTSVLGVDRGVVIRHGVVSRACAAAMAERARDLFSASWAVSATGVAGPDRQEGKPPGTVYVGLAHGHGVRVEALALSGSRNEIRAATVQQVLALLAGMLAEAGSR